MASAGDTSPTALHVSVTPAQVAFFAGEPLTVTITITNSRPPFTNENGASFAPPFLPGSMAPIVVSSTKMQGRSQSAVVSPRHAHKRSSHSVSHVPIAHPPTSPGIGQIRHASSSSLSLPTAYSKQVFEEVKEMRRKNRIGKGIQSRRTINGENGCATIGKGKGKEIDVETVQLRSMAAPDRKNGLPRGIRDEDRFGTDSSPRISSPLARESAVPSSHPHARKQSLLDGSVASSSVLGLSPSSSAASSTTTVSTSLGSIAESPRIGQTDFPSSSPTPSQATAPSPSPYQYVFVPPSVSQSPPYLQPPSSPRTAPIPDFPGKMASTVNHVSQVSLGHGYPRQPYTAAVSAFPHATGRAALSDDGSELILYSYVHFTGMLTLIPPPMHERTWSETVRRMRMRRRTRGGGSMDIAAMSPQAANTRLGRHARRSSVGAGLWGLLSPTSPTSPSPADSSFKPGHRLRSSTSSAFFAQSSRVIGLGVEGIDDDFGEEQELEVPMTVFEVPNAMLGVDVRLKPGESKNWTYTVNLPDWLPPTYDGRAVKFSYQLAVGACRALPGGSNSRVMKVPVRVYNHVSGMSTLHQYTRAISYSTLHLRDSISSLRTYAEQLILPTPSPEHEHALSPGEIEPEREGPLTLTGCREAVEILTRVPKRVSYDIQKEGVKVAVLTFTKAAWRLGETVQGIVEVNDRDGRARVLKADQAHESLPSALGTSASEAKFMRRAYAEDHAAVLSCTLRTTFALDIPSDAAPAFSLKLGDGIPPANGHANDPHLPSPAATRGGVEWKVRVCLLVCVAPERARVRGARRKGDVGEWASSYIPTSTPLCHRVVEPAALRTSTDSVGSWTAWFTSTFVAPTTYHDGDMEGESTHESDTEDEDEVGWEEMRTEMVECEVPVHVWPGNTAFRAMDVVFDV
ncbi:hypothetical protein K488DRAFT_77699 [Vararia minispora EC-137]|uniref:Uncharacterized protein n=1 Tax=Vararia minispora EC-137 TaxID=1314806 RepID=A0ACB8QQ05_9AGAM|nr:hypothetical protein K488DRAFT_77699 [Vararia minispora EC-137]